MSYRITLSEKMIEWLKTFGYYVFLIVLIVIFGFPYFWFVLNSFKTTQEANAIPPTILPRNPTINSWINVLTGKTVIKLPTPWGKWFANGLMVSIVSAAYVTIATMLACYSLAKLKPMGRDFILAVILASIILPGPAIFIPIYSIAVNLNILDNPVGLILLYPILVLPLTVWITISSFAAIPSEIEEAAQIDGCSRLRTFFTIILPSMKMTLATMFTIAFLICWGEYPFAYVLLRSHENYTPAIGVATYLLEFNIFWDEVAVSTCLVTIPVVILFVILHRYIVRQVFYGIVRR